MWQVHHGRRASPEWTTVFEWQVGEEENPTKSVQGSGSDPKNRFSGSARAQVLEASVAEPSKDRRHSGIRTTALVTVTG